MVILLAVIRATGSTGVKLSTLAAATKRAAD